MEIDTTDSGFEKEVIEKSKEMPVVVDFWASWCGPCQMLKPIMEKVGNSDELKDKVVIAKLNVEQNQEKASEYGIMSIPAVKLFKDGKVVDEFIGVKTEEDVKQWISQHL